MCAVYCIADCSLLVAFMFSELEVWCWRFGWYIIGGSEVGNYEWYCCGIGGNCGMLLEARRLEVMVRYCCGFEYGIGGRTTHGKS